MTGSIHNASKTICKYHETGSVDLTLLADSDLKYGQEVYLSGNNKVEKRTTSAQFPIGVVVTPGLDTKNVTVATIFQRTIQALNTEGGNLVAGDFVYHDGSVDANGLPGYAKADTDGDIVSGIVISGGADDTEVRVGLLRVPVKITAPAV